MLAVHLGVDPLRNLKNLRKLVISYVNCNSNGEWIPNGNPFRDLLNLEYLQVKLPHAYKCSEFYLTTISLPNLKWLHITMVKLDQELINSIISSPKMTILKLESCELKTNIFIDDLPRLRYFCLTDLKLPFPTGKRKGFNVLLEYEEKYLELGRNLNSIEWIRLNGFYLKNPSILKTFTNLIYLDLHGNIIELTPDIFKNLDNLEELLLEVYEEKDYDVFQGDSNKNCVYLPKLTRLFLKHNIENLRPDMFVNLKQVKSLRLESSGQRENFPAVFQPLDSLEELALKMDIKKVQENSFDGLTSLKILNLCSCRIQELSLDAFTCLNQLKDLNLSNNNLEEIKQGLFSSLRCLEILNLSSNKLVLIEDNAFKGLESLENLNLEKNTIKKTRILHFF